MAEAVGRDLAEAKALLSRATRPNVKQVLASFIKTQTARELELLTGSVNEGEDPALSTECPPDGPPNPCPPEPKKNASDPGDALPVAPRFKVAPSQLPKDVASPAPTKLVRAGSAAPSTAKTTWVAPAYGWEQGEYNSPWVNVLISLEGVGAAKERCHCDFGIDSFDLRVTDVQGTNYRLVVEALDKDIVPEESRLIVKKNRITLKLKKVKGEYSYDHWTDLKKKGGKAAKDKSRNKDPSAGIMDMMKDLYDNGDDNMRKIIGESMMKSRNGEKQDPSDIELPQSPSIDDDDATEPDKGGFDLDDTKAKMPPVPEGRLPDLSSIPGMEDFKMDPTSE